METVKKILKTVAGMLAGAAVGYGGVMLIMWLIDGGMPSAKSHSEGVDYRLMALGKKLPQLYILEVGGERVMLELLTTQRHDVVDELWDKQLECYTIANSKYSPIKCAVLYAYELLHKYDAEKADTYKQQFDAHRDDYTMPGEAKTTTILIDSIRENKITKVSQVMAHLHNLT